MTVFIFQIAFSLFIPWIAGYCLYQFIFRRHPLPIPLAMALSFALGLGVLTQFMLLMAFFHLPFSVEMIYLPILFFAGYILLLSLSENTEPVETTSLRAPAFPDMGGPALILTKFLCFLLSVYIIYVTTYVFWRTMNIPTCYWDEIAFIAYKAKIFFYERTIVPLDNLPWPSYPLHVPLSETWIALNLGQWDDQWIKIIFPPAFISYLIIHYEFLRRFTSRLWSLTGVALLVSANFFSYHATIGYNDFFLMFYNCATIFMLILWARTRKSAYLTTGALLGGFMTFIKLEGMIYLLMDVVLLLISLSRQKIYSLRAQIYFFKFTALSCGITLIYQIYKVLHHIPTAADRLDFQFSPDHFSRVIIMIRQIGENLFLSGNWHILWYLLVLSLIAQASKLRNSNKLRLLGVSLGMFFGLFLAFALLATDTVWAGFNFQNTLSRVILHFYPLCPLLIVLLNAPRIAKKESS